MAPIYAPSPMDTFPNNTALGATVAKSLISQSCITLHNVFSFTKSPINALDDTFTPDCITEPIPIVADLDILAEGLITVSK